ncbi:MAG: hypothetical protein Q4G00_01350 [Clostridia bacterium]|nr:hypothetical protein [Clostridia bacterium]
MFRLISPPMKFPPQAVIGGSSLDPLLAKILDRYSQETPRAALGTEYSKLSGTMKIGEIGPGKSRLTRCCIIPGNLWLPGIDQAIIGGLSLARFRLFSPDAKHPVWRLSAAVPESD